MNPITRGRFVVVACGLSALASLPAVAGQAQETPVIRAGVDQVVVDVVVTDAAGRAVPGLTAADFQVRERGAAQRIATFTEVGLPLPPGMPPAPAATGGTAAVAASGDRYYVLLFDDYHIALERTAAVRAAGAAYVSQYVTADDRVGVLTTSGLGGSNADPTRDRRKTLAAINQFVGRSGGLSAIPVSRERTQPGRNADRMAAQQTSSFSVDDTGSDEHHEALARAETSMRTLANTADELAKLPGSRKAVLYFSSGVAIPPDNDYGLNARLDEVIAAAARANVAVYSFDPGGLSHLDPNRLTGSGDVLAEGVRQGTKARILAAGMLRSLSERSGGVASVDRNDTAKAFEQVALDSSHYYLLGYTPTDTRRDGRFRSIDVTVLKPGLTVRARKGYVAPKDKR
jgi:VWFA-related protein